MDALLSARASAQASGEQLQQCYNEIVAQWRVFGSMPEHRDLALHASKSMAKLGEAMQMNERLRVNIQMKMEALVQQEEKDQARMKAEWEKAQQQKQQQQRKANESRAGEPRDPYDNFEMPDPKQWQHDNFTGYSDQTEFYNYDAEFRPREPFTQQAGSFPYGHPYYFARRTQPRPPPEQTLWDEFTANKTPDHASLPSFPDPPIASFCRNPAVCSTKAPGRALQACDCQIEDAVRRIPGVNLKGERVKWHPDRFSGCAEGLREGMKRKAECVFKVVNEMYVRAGGR